MNGNSHMNSNQWIALECLVILAALGIASFFWEPKYSMGLGMILGAVIAALNNALGVQSGSHLPEQAGDAKPGQVSQTKTTSETTTQAPPAEEPK